MAKNERLSAVILAGGQGRRMGGADKGLVEYRGRPLIEWLLESLHPQVDEIFISANRNLESYARYGHRVLPDTLPDFPGPLAGVLTAMEAVTSDWLLVVPCDTPHLPADLAYRLLHAARASGAPLAVAADPARVHHTTMLVQTRLADSLRDYLDSGQRAVKHWQAQFPLVQIEFPAGLFDNFNTAADLGVERDPSKIG